VRSTKNISSKKARQKNGEKKWPKKNPENKTRKKFTGKNLRKIMGRKFTGKFIREEKSGKGKRESGRPYTGGISVPFQKGIYDSRRT
jgi:hypothetical protein